MRIRSRSRARATTLLIVGLAVAAAPIAAQDPLEPTEIAALAQATTVQIRSLDGNGRRIGAGSGFVVGTEGHIVTNFHVIDRAQSLRVTLPDGTEFKEVLFVAADPGHDVALLKVAAASLPFLRLRGDPEPAVGQRVYTMGHPLGQTATFSDGLVSALRSVEEVDLIQITAPISSGSSGGPVMNAAGEVIGIATMMLRGGQNLNFAVPARYLAPLLESGVAPRPFAASLLPRARRGIALLGGPPGAERIPITPRTRASDAPAPRDVWEEQVLRRLARLEAVLTAEGGARRSHPIEMGALQNGQSRTFRLPLEAGTSYAIIAACDEDCGALEVRLVAPDGTALHHDSGPSDVPLVRHTAAAAGTHQVRVTMSGCSDAPCRFGVTSFALR